jgi:hypothetical protein
MSVLLHAVMIEHLFLVIFSSGSYHLAIDEAIFTVAAFWGSVVVTPVIWNSLLRTCQTTWFAFRPIHRMSELAMISSEQLPNEFTLSSGNISPGVQEITIQRIR